MTKLLTCLLLLLTMVVCPLPEAEGHGILLTGSGSGDATRSRAPRVLMTTHRVRAKILDGVADVTVEQVFRSHAQSELEGTYIFPLPEGAVVSDFAMTMGGKMVKGEVVEAQKARNIYEGIVRRRRDPGLLEYLGKGLFRARVFPIVPGEDMTIRLSFQQVLREDRGTLEFRYPLATDRLNGSPVASVELDVDVRSTEALKAVYSPSHPVEVTRSGDRQAAIQYRGSGQRQTRDFLLYVGRDKGDVGVSVLSHKDAAADGTFMAVLAPRTTVADAQRVGRDIIFVLDTSGSMAGEKMDQARKALSYGVQTLHEKDRFNIIAFSTSVRSWRRGLVPFQNSTRDGAVDWIRQLEAAGGTDIHSALLEALRLAREDRRCMIVFLTDGTPTVGVTNPTRLVTEITAQNKQGARIFTFGVGHDLNVKMLDLIAEGNRGTRDYVGPREDIEVVTGRFFRQVSKPVLTDVEISLGDDVYDVYPKQIGDLFSGTQVVLFGRYKKGGDRAITLTGKLEGQQKRYAYAAKLSDASGPTYLERLWAHRKVAYLLDNIRLHGEVKELKDEVIALATQHAIVTPYTSGLVIEDGSAFVPAGGQGRRLGNRVETDNDLPFEESFGMSDAPYEGPANNGSIVMGGGAGGSFVGRGGARDLGTGGGGRKRFDDASEDGLRWLASHQSPNGSWEAAGYGRWCDGKPSTSSGQRLDGAGSAAMDPGLTGLALSAFLSAGYTHRGKHPFARVVSRGLRYLKNIRDPEGCFGPRSTPTYMLNHAMAALAMVEAYGMTGSPIFKGASQRALDFIALARNPYAAWGFGIKPGTNDLRVTAWMLHVLAGANAINRDAQKRGLRAPLVVDLSAYEGVRTWLASVTPKDHGTPGAAAIHSGVSPAQGGTSGPAARTAMALWCHFLLGEDPSQSALLEVGARTLRRVSPERMERRHR